MRALIALLVVATAVAPADAQLARVVTGPSVSQGQANQPNGRAWRGYSRGSYSRSATPSRPAYSQPTRRTPSQFQRSTWRPRATYYSNRSYSQQPIPQPAVTIQTPGIPAPIRNPQVGDQTQVQRPVDKARQATADQPQQELTEDEKQEQARKARQEQWRQFQIQEAQRQAYYQRYGDPATRRFWQDIYSYNRSFHNQNMHGYSFHGQNTTGQNMYGYSNYNQSWAGQSYSQPSFHLQSRFNQSPPIYNFHNIIVPGAGNWRY